MKKKTTKESTSVIAIIALIIAGCSLFWQIYLQIETN